ncbi:MAG: hypothetical protein DRQ89_11810 [Epsilonproteobacteria bacterium]|nr:MAG: hypothetical protein DRQ89_11810 [Campylobacterota bacterium]
MAVKLSEMNLAKILILILFLFSSSAHSFYTEIGANYSFQREVYGVDYESKLNENTLLTSVAFYFFSLTGLEIGYSWRKVDNLDKTVSLLNNDRYQTGYRRTLNVQNFSVGISQYFNSTKAILRPGIGAGFTRRITEDGGYTDIYDDNTDEAYRLERDTTKTTSDLIYVLASLKFRVVEGLFLSGSVRTLFSPKKYDDAQNNLRFFVGFSWLF